LLQYRTRCHELEQRLEGREMSVQVYRRETTEDRSLEKALLQLEEEQQRKKERAVPHSWCENLAKVNTLLREHLDKANEVNSALKEDVGKLTADWMRAREELELKESEWRSEREFYESYLRGEHNRLLSLWRQVVTFRRHFLEMKTATDRDLSELKAEQMRLSASILGSCFRLNSGIQLWESFTVGRPVLKDHTQQQVEREINKLALEVKCLQVEGDLEKKELQDRVMELSALLVHSQKQNEEKEKTVKTLNNTVEILEASRLEVEYEASLTKNAKEENLALQRLVKGITEVVLDDSDSAVSIVCADNSQRQESSRILSCLSSLDAEHAFVLVQEALARRQRATQALKEELSARQDSINLLQDQHRQQEEKCKRLQQRLEQLEEESKVSTSHQQHLKSLVQALKSECADLEKTRGELQQRLELSQQEALRLRLSNTELQLKEDSAQGEKVEQQLAMERAHHDKELLLKDLAALEAKRSLLQNELVVTKVTLEESHLQRDLLKQEKHELTMALEKAEQSVAELTGAQNKLHSEIADLRAATAKMSSINEALALDKVQLNKLVLQLEQDNEVLSEKVNEMERAKVSVQEKMSLCKRANEELCAEKSRLEQLLKKAEEQQEELQVQLRILAEEKEETQEKLSQVCRQQESASSGLEQLRQESSRQEEALAKVFKERELLVCEKAALEVRLAATERDRQGLSERLAEARSVKETLESSLFEAQQRSSQLEITRSQLEIQLHAVIQAKEVIQGEVKCLQYELETERSLMKQERENKAQQLLQTEQQYNSTLRLQKADHEVEINKLLQDLASEREGHHLELQGMLERWEKEKAETEGEYEKELIDMKQKVATMQAQQEEERTRVENANREVLIEKENEKKALLETLLHTQGELTEACQQLEQLRQEVKEQQEHGQNITAKLQAELQETHCKLKAVENMHKEEVETIREELDILLQQRDDLQKQVEELTAQLAASEESHRATGHKAQQDLSEAQELSRQKVLEVVRLQKLLEEERSQLSLSLEQKELSLKALEEDNLAQQNKVSKLLAATQQAQQLHSDHRREIQDLNNQVQSLQEVVLEKEACLAAREKQLLQELEGSRASEECLKDSLHVLEAEMAELHLRLCNTETRAKALAIECQQANSAHCEAQSQLDKLYLVLHHMLCDSSDASRGIVTWKWLLSSEQDRVWDLTASQARDLPVELTVDRVAAALQDLRQDLKQTQQDLNDAGKKIQDLELELSKRQAETDHFSARSQELEKQLAQSQEEGKKNSLQAALWAEAAALKKEAMTLCQQVASMERKLESAEKQKQDLLHERDRLQAAEEKLLWEIKLLQESVTDSETRANTAADRSHSLEQELQTTLSILKIKNEEVETQREKIQVLQKEAADVKALQENLTQVNAILSKREGEMKSYQEQMRMLENQKEMLKTTLHRVIKDITEEKQKTESQQELIRELEKQQEKQRIAASKMSKDLEDRDQEIRSQQELIEELQKQRQLQRSAVSKMSKELEEIISLRKQCEACNEKEEKHEADQAILQETKMALKERERKIEVLEEAISKLQQQNEEAVMQTTAMMQKLEYAESSLAARDQEIVSLKEHVHELQQQEESEGKQVKSLQQDLNKMSQTMKKNNLEILKQSEQINVFRLREESMKVALTSCQNQVNRLEEVVRNRDEDNKTLLQKLKHQEEELKTLQNLQLMLSEKKEEIKHHREQEKLLEEALREREREAKVQGEQKRLEAEEIRGLREDLQHVQQTLTKKDEEIKYQRDRVKFLQERDHFLKRQKELAQQLENERKVKGEELERVIAILKQTESGEIEWKEKAQALTLALSQSEMANGSLREEIAILQSMVSERDEDRFHLQARDRSPATVLLLLSPELLKELQSLLLNHVQKLETTHIVSSVYTQQAIAEGEQPSWLSEKKLLWQQLECLQQAVARLEHEKTELKQLNAELRRTLEQVERERRRLKRSCSSQSLPGSCRFSLSESDEDKMPASRKEEVRALCRQLSELQSQVTLLQQQLAQERKYKQDYIECCARTSQELSDLHQELSDSLAAVVREPKAAVMEAETQKLDQSLNHTLALLSLDCWSPERQSLH
ncbi:CP250 protein, partial [Alectura lathami]|nr:CP250 protein [Alectura lathami]